MDDADQHGTPAGQAVVHVVVRHVNCMRVRLMVKVKMNVLPAIMCMPGDMQVRAGAENQSK